MYTNAFYVQSQHACISYILLWFLTGFRGSVRLGDCGIFAAASNSILHILNPSIPSISLLEFILFSYVLLGLLKSPDPDRPGYAMHHSQVDIQVYDLVNGIVFASWTPSVVKPTRGPPEN